jgi:hypothetical protein
MMMIQREQQIVIILIQNHAQHEHLMAPYKADGKK